ncbi:calmodulin-A-like [Mytilus californianus]|uniref:calmodulin-A-like n=1 Tax=Mytilus californianus TaxID=6549 RepID=UPI0022459692|nr:calmodulin-A-like [Mytilus californianus]
MADGKSKLTKAQVQEFKEAFKNFDKNGDGKISCKELRTFLKSVGQDSSDAEVQRIMIRVDHDNSGSIEFQEFLTMMSTEETEKSPATTDQFRDAFREFDKDGNGVITMKEFKKAMAKVGNKLSDKQIKQMIKEVDLDGDGEINYKEFVQMMSK